MPADRVWPEPSYEYEQGDDADLRSNANASLLNALKRASNDSRREEKQSTKDEYMGRAKNPNSADVGADTDEYDCRKRSDQRDLH